MDELAALSALVRASEGRATPEPVIGLAIAVASPWAGDRRDLRDQPNRSAPSTPDALLRFVRDVRPQLAAPLPSSTGWLAWLRYSGLAKPLEEIEKGPAWIRSPELAGGWLVLPPRGGYHGLDSGTVSRDGRLAFLHVLCSQVAPASVPLDAALCLLEWFIGPRAAEWSHLAADQCPAMAFPQVRYRAWHATFRSVRPSHVLPVVTGRAFVPADWTRPAPTAGELAAAEEIERRRRATAINAQTWHKPRRSVGA